MLHCAIARQVAEKIAQYNRIFKPIQTANRVNELK